MVCGTLLRKSFPLVIKDVKQTGCRFGPVDDDGFRIFSQSITYTS
jgi:hypothetical protein